MKLEIDDYFTDEIVRQNLEESTLDMLEQEPDMFETLDNKAELFAAMCCVLEYYSTLTQYLEFKDKIRGKSLL